MMFVFRKIRTLQKLLGNRYKEIFQINLSDNGIEFNKFHEPETDKYGTLLCRVFFTNPYRSTDKASCEKNHEFIRYVIPTRLKASIKSINQNIIITIFLLIN